MCGIWVYVEDTQSVTFLTPILLLVNFPVPLLPWVTPQDFAIRDHFFGFSKVRVWGRKKKEREQEKVPESWEGKTEKRFTSQKSPYSTHSSLPGLSAFLQTHSIHSHLRAFALPVLSATWVSYHTSLPQEGHSHCSHSQSFMLLLPSSSLFPFVAVLYFTEFFATWNHTICCDYLLLTITCHWIPRNWNISSMRADTAFIFILFFFDISFSIDIAGGIEREETGTKGWERCTSSQRERQLMGQRKVNQTDSGSSRKN